MLHQRHVSKQHGASTERSLDDNDKSKAASYSRLELSKFGIAAFIAIVIVVASASAIAVHSRQDVDVYFNATFYNSDSTQFSTLAVDAVSGRVVAAGGAEVWTAFASTAKAVIDLRGKTVIPGMIDSHGHLMELGEARSQAQLLGSKSPAEVVRRLIPFAEPVRRNPGRWLKARGWDQNLFATRDFPTKFDLDTDFPDIPVYLDRIDSHACWVNSHILKLVSVPPSDPPGGRIIRFPNGEPTGVFIDAACQFITNAIPPSSDSEMDELMQAGADLCAAAGLTSVHYAGVSNRQVASVKRLIAAGKFKIRLYAMLRGAVVDVNDWCDKRQPWSPSADQNQLAVQAVKLFADGALGSRGAALLQPYSDDQSNNGLLLMTPEDHYNATAAWIKCGFQVNTHAIGDRANRIVLTNYADVIRQQGKRKLSDGSDDTYANELRLRMEHASIVAAEDFALFRQYDIISSMQPLFATSDMHYAEDRLGPVRIRRTYAWRTFIENGIRVAFGSDFPIEFEKPILGFYAAVSRQSVEGMPPGGWYSDQLVTRQEALRSFTSEAAYAGFQENDVGSLAPGKLADFIVLSGDIMKIPVNSIPGVVVEATYLGGKQVFNVHA